MAKRRRTIQTHFERMTVVVNEKKTSGGSIFRTDDLSHLPYQVLATYLHSWEGGSTTPAFLLKAPDGRIVERACDRFKVVEIE